MKSLLNKALKFARVKHKGQYRDDGVTPYVVHPMQVAQILTLLFKDENLICAALLHDVIEDTDTTYEDLKKEFNMDIADLVMEVTKKEGILGRAATFPNLKTQRGIMLKFADRLSNISDMKSWSEKKKEWYLKSSKFWKS